MTRATVGLLFVILLCGCASTGAAGRKTEQDRITREEIQSADVSTLYDVVQRLRPRWLSMRGQQSFGLDTDIVVYQGQSYLGGVEVLRRMSPSMAYALQYLDGPTASATLPGLGSRHVESAIVIEVAP